MKSLLESIFDDNLVEKELPLYEMVKKLNRDNIKKLSQSDIKKILEELCKSGEKCNKQSLLKHNPVDLSKNIIIAIEQVMDAEAPINRHFFVYKTRNGYLLTRMISKHNQWKWEILTLENADDWKQESQLISNMFFTLTTKFIILDKKISELIIKGIGY